MEDPADFVIKELVIKAVALCTDTDLLDLIYKLLTNT